MDRLIAFEMSGASDAETPDQAAARLGLTWTTTRQAA